MAERRRGIGWWRGATWMAGGLALGGLASGCDTAPGASRQGQRAPATEQPIDPPVDTPSDAPLDQPAVVLGVASQLDSRGVARANEGVSVEPQTVLHLDAGSVPDGASVYWTVDQPDGSRSRFVPSDAVATPSFEVNVAGDYHFRVGVTHADGTTEMRHFALAAVPSGAIHVELLWSTTGDADESDEGEGVGTDLDLHFASPLAKSPDIDDDGGADPWFDVDWDVFWFNRAPHWGAFPSIDDDPTLDRDDTDGAGPENLNVLAPAAECYAIGVHFWNAFGYFGTTATIRIFVHGTLTWAATSDLSELDLWNVGELCWQDDTASFTPDGAIFADYVNPFFRPPLYN